MQNFRHGAEVVSVVDGERPGSRRWEPVAVPPRLPVPAAQVSWTYIYVANDVYNRTMRRIQIYMDEDLDDLLETDAARLGVSKASLIRDAVAQRYAGRSDEDPVTALIGAYDGPAGDSVDDVVYR